MILETLKNTDKPGGIVWLASYPKSGNTWLRIFLYHITRIMQGSPLEGNDLNHLDRSSLYEARMWSLFVEALGKPVEQASLAEMVEARPRVHEEFVKRTGQLMLLKTHMALASINGKPAINLDVTLGAVYVVRNPLDLVLSLSNHTGLPIDDAITLLCRQGFAIPNMGEELYEPWGSWSENVESWTGRPPAMIHVIRYEDMLDSPIMTFRSVMDHLRQSPGAAQLAEAVELSSFSRLSALEKEVKFRERSPNAERFFRVGKAGQYRDKLTDAQIGRIVEANYRQMSRFGYLTPNLHHHLPADAKIVKPALSPG